MDLTREVRYMAIAFDAENGQEIVYTVLTSQLQFFQIFAIAINKDRNS